MKTNLMVRLDNRKIGEATGSAFYIKRQLLGYFCNSSSAYIKKKMINFQIVRYYALK